MKKRRLSLLLLSLLAAGGCGPDLPEPEPVDLMLEPFKGNVQAPESYQVKLETTKGDVLIVVNRPWAPNGADRFYNLLRRGFFTDVAFFRVVERFMAQFGLHGDAKVNRAWMAAFIPSDIPVQSNRRGFVAFAQQGSPERRSTQLFINLRDNPHLDRSFAPIGQVVEGMDVVDALYNGYGESVSQGRILYEGNAYLKKFYPRLDWIKRATIVE